MFVILFEVLLIEIQEEIHHFVVWEGGGSRGTKIVNKHFVNKLAFPNPLLVKQRPNCARQSLASLVAPYCAIPRDYLSDTPLLRAMGFSVSQHGQMGAIPPPPFSEHFPLGEHAKWRCETPSEGVSQRYLRDTL